MNSKYQHVVKINGVNRKEGKPGLMLHTGSGYFMMECQSVSGDRCVFVEIALLSYNNMLFDSAY
jgi:hypothetical protein